MFGEAQGNLIPASRKALVEWFILEPGLKDLVDDLLTLPDSTNNRNILVRALRGEYSGFRSTYVAPMMTLYNHLGTAKYSAMQEKVEAGKYEHDCAPKQIGNFTYNAKRFITEAPPNTSQSASNQYNPSPSCAHNDSDQANTSVVAATLAHSMSSVLSSSSSSSCSKSTEKDSSKEDIVKRERENLEASMTCPITQELMNDPVILVGDRQTYERKAITEWLKSHNTSPLNGAALASKGSKKLIPNGSLRSAIEAYRKIQDLTEKETVVTSSAPTCL